MVTKRGSISEEKLKTEIYCFQDVYGVVIGGILGHSFCTGLAVLGGRMISQKISVRTGKCVEIY